MKWEKSFYHRRPIVSLAGKHPEKTDHNVSIIHSSFILWHDWERKRQQLWQMQQWAHWMWSQKRT
jgi:hypothetical protein